MKGTTGMEASLLSCFVCAFAMALRPPPGCLGQLGSAAKERPRGTDLLLSKIACSNVFLQVVSGTMHSQAVEPGDT